MQGLDDEICEKLQDEIHISNGNKNGLGEDMEGYDEEMTHNSSEIFILQRGIKLGIVPEPKLPYLNSRNLPKNGQRITNISRFYFQINQS